MNYEYDAFFSYKRDPESDDWHEKVKDKLTYWLRQQLSRSQVRIFFDREDIRTGNRWRTKLGEALKSSRCIICLWSPLYFQSKWCLSEWKTFDERSKLAKRDLVLPASYFDGETFPPAARELQFKNFSHYASTMPGFWETGAAVEFEDTCLRPFAGDLAQMIQRCPAFSDSFPIVEAVDAEVQEENTIRRVSEVG
jgi:hypothetical protein